MNAEESASAFLTHIVIFAASVRVRQRQLVRYAIECIPKHVVSSCQQRSSQHAHLASNPRYLDRTSPPFLASRRFAASRARLALTCYSTRVLQAIRAI